MVARGQVWWADIPEPNGSAAGYRRPVLVVQADALNASRLRTVLVVPLTSTLRLAGMPGNLLLPRSKTGLTKDSVANVSLVTALDRDELTEMVATLPRTLMREIDAGLQLVLSLA